MFDVFNLAYIWQNDAITSKTHIFPQFTLRSVKKIIIITILPGKTHH